MIKEAHNYELVCNVCEKEETMVSEARAENGRPLGEWGVISLWEDGTAVCSRECAETFFTRSSAKNVDMKVESLFGEKKQKYNFFTKTPS